MYCELFWNRLCICVMIAGTGSSCQMIPLNCVSSEPLWKYVIVLTGDHVERLSDDLNAQEEVLVLARYKLQAAFLVQICFFVTSRCQTHFLVSFAHVSLLNISYWLKNSFHLLSKGGVFQFAVSLNAVLLVLVAFKLMTDCTDNEFRSLLFQRFLADLLKSSKNYS